MRSDWADAGDYIFDDAFWDENGYHAQPEGCWIPQAGARLERLDEWFAEKPA